MRCLATWATYRRSIRLYSPSLTVGCLNLSTRLRPAGVRAIQLGFRSLKAQRPCRDLGAASTRDVMSPVLAVRSVLKPDGLFGA